MKDLGFKNKLLLTVSVLIIICMGTSSILFYQQEKKALVDTIYATAKERISFESHKVSQYLESKAKAVSRLADDYKAFSYMDGHVERLRSNALALDVTNLMLGFDDGVAYASIEYPGWIAHKNTTSYDPRTRFWYQTGIKHQAHTFITQHYNDQMTGELMVSIGKYAGLGRVLLADIPLDVLSEVVSDIDMDGFAAIIIDGKNSVLASSSSAVKVGEILTEQQAFSTISELVRAKRSAVVSYQPQGEDRVLFAHKVPYANVDWYLLVELDTKVVLTQLNKIKQQAMMFMLIYLFFSVIITLIVLNILYRPIQALKDTILGLSEGSGYITQRLEVTSSDDLGKIALGVNRFIDQIQQLLLRKSEAHPALTEGEKELQELDNRFSQRWEDAFAEYQYHATKEQLLREELQVDSTTKLPTRSYFEVLLTEAIREVYSQQSELVLLTINIGNYETLSESYTYQQLHTAVVELAKKVNSMLPQGSILSRTGQTEFSAILKSTQDDGVDLKSLVAQFAVQLKSLDTSVILFHCKVGAAHLDYRDDKASVSGLFYRVNNALFSISEHADENYAFYHKQREAEKERKQALIVDFKAALKSQDELELYFQPQIDIATHRVRGAEALIRWNHPTQGFLTPDRFVHVVEDDPALNIQFGEWLIVSALQKLAVRDDEMTISVNITPSHLQHEDFASRLQQILSQYPAALSQRLKIELTESAGISDHGRVQASMHRCSQLGVRFSLDDFGTGYSTLSQLRNLPASELKIDRSFIRNIEKSAEDKKMVMTIMMLAKGFDISVVVEGVENGEQERLLKTLGCSTIQGYYYSKPVPYQELNLWLESYQASQR